MVICGEIISLQYASTTSQSNLSLIMDGQGNLFTWPCGSIHVLFLHSDKVEGNASWNINFSSTSWTPFFKIMWWCRLKKTDVQVKYQLQDKHTLLESGYVSCTVWTLATYVVHPEIIKTDLFSSHRLKATIVREWSFTVHTVALPCLTYEPCQFDTQD